MSHSQVKMRWKRSDTTQYSPGILQIRLTTGTNWVNYNHPSVAAYYKPDHPIANGSKGYACMQNCLKLGVKYVQELDWQNFLDGTLPTHSDDLLVWLKGEAFEMEAFSTARYEDGKWLGDYDRDLTKYVTHFAEVKAPN